MADNTDFNDFPSQAKVTAHIEGSAPVGGGNDAAGETNEQVVARLASMKPMDYDRVREAEAQQLGVRVGTLDTEVAKMRFAAGRVDGQGAVPLFVEVEPWPDSVNGAELLKDLAAVFLQYVFMPGKPPRSSRYGWSTRSATTFGAALRSWG